jgi:hypothetical protein
MLRLKNSKAKSDFKKRAIQFAKTLKDGLSKEYKKDYNKFQKEAACLEKNL